MGVYIFNSTAEKLAIYSDFMYISRIFPTLFSKLTPSPPDHSGINIFVFAITTPARHLGSLFVLVAFDYLGKGIYNYVCVNEACAIFYRLVLQNGYLE